jgi:3-deoxy-D-manno-octulosonate 8-phosphate phosphatase (KDO 8-P phosphatase)
MSLTPEARAHKIKVLIFDVDGVLTDGQIIIVPEGTAPDAKGIEVKGFSAHDGLGITLARLAGIRVGVITKRQSRTVAIRARDLKLEFVYQGQAHKMNAINDILAKTAHTIDQLAYVGDDIVDLPVMRQCGLSIATANARKEVKSAAHYVTPNPGGFGAGRDAIDFILTAQGTLEKVIEQYLDESNTAAASSDVGQGNMYITRRRTKNEQHRATISECRSKSPNPSPGRTPSQPSGS